jgi:hypothetical protein
MFFRTFPKIFACSALTPPIKELSCFGKRMVLDCQNCAKARANTAPQAPSQRTKIGQAARSPANFAAFQHQHYRFEASARLKISRESRLIQQGQGKNGESPDVFGLVKRFHLTSCGGYGTGRGEYETLCSAFHNSVEVGGMKLCEARRITGLLVAWCHYYFL